MGKSVRFAEALEAPSTVQNTRMRGILRKTPPPTADPTGHAITQVYHGGTKVHAVNLYPIYRQLVKVLESGSYAQNGGDSPASQDIEYPTCLEAYSVLNTILRIQVDEKSSQAPPVHPNQLLVWAKRDFLAYKTTRDILNSRVSIQILRAVDFLFYADTCRQSINKASAKFFLDEALEGITGSSTSKALLGICLHIFNHIHLPKLLDKQIVVQLLEILRQKSQATRSSALTAEFVLTCKTIYRHYNLLMGQNASLWIPLVMDTLFDQSSYIRSQGSQFILELVRQKNPQLSLAIYKHLNSRIDQGASEPVLFIEFAVKRMISFLETGSDVKQTMAVWSSLLLFMGGDPGIELESWPHLSEWLEVPRYGFTSSSLSVKEATYLAWKNVLYLFLFRYDNNLSISRNITSLLNPIKPKRQSSTAIFEKFCSCFDVCLFMALRTCEQTTKHLDITFNFLIEPCIRAMIEHPNLQIKRVGYKYITTLCSMPSTGSRVSRDRILEEKPISSTEIGGLPKQWVKNNVNKLIDILGLVTDNSLGYDLVSKLWISIVGIVRQQASSTTDNSVYSHLLACINYLNNSSKSFTLQEINQLSTNFLCSFNYDILVAPKYKLEAETGKVQASDNGEISCAILMISHATDSTPEAFDQLLSRFTTLPSRQVAIISQTILSNKNDPSIRTHGISHMIRLLSQPGFGYFEEEDVHQVTKVLEYMAAPNEISKEWMSLFTHCFNRADYPALFTGFLERLVELEGYFDLFFNLKKSLFIDVGYFDKFLVEITLQKTPQKLKATYLADFPVEFRIFVGRYLFNTLEQGKMEDGVEIIGESALKENVDIFLDAIAAGSTHANNIWTAQFVERTPPGEFLLVHRSRAKDLHQMGRMVLPQEIPPRTSTPSKRLLESMESLEPPKTPTKRARGILADSYIPSPPVTSDVGDLCSSPPSSRKNTDIQTLMRILHPSTFSVDVKTLQDHQIIDLKARLEQSLELLNGLK